MPRYDSKKIVTAVVTALVLASMLMADAVGATTTATVNGNASTKAAAANADVSATLEDKLHDAAVQEAAKAAAETAKSPELQTAVKSFWQLAGEAFSAFASRMWHGFLGLFAKTWDDATTPQVNAAANVNTAP